MLSFHLQYPTVSLPLSSAKQSSTLIHSAARIAVNLPRSTPDPLQIINQLTNIPAPKLLLEKEITLRLNSLLMQPHKKTHKLLVLHTPIATHSKSLIKKFKLSHDPTPKMFPSLPIHQFYMMSSSKLTLTNSKISNLKTFLYSQMAQLKIMDLDQDM